MRKLLPPRTLILGCFAVISQFITAQNFPSGFSQVKVGTVYYPTAMAKTPDGRIFVTEKSGRVKVVKNGAILSTPFVNLSNVEETNERGLGGIAIDPNFSTNRYVYLYYTTTNPVRNRLSRFTANGDVAVPGSEVVLIDFEPVVNSIHNGGGMAFGPDGKLYLAMGDDKVSSNAQTLSNHKGKLLRLNRDGSPASGNPFSGSTAASRIWAYGFRNPFSISIDPLSGKIFVNDVGEGAWEEINNATTAGKNFGWPAAEGNSSNSAFTNPVLAYHHSNGGTLFSGCAVSGGAFFSPSATNYPSNMVGKYFYLDYCNDWINYIDPAGGTPTNFASNIPGAGIALMTGADGNLYYMSISQSGLYKIVYNGGNAPVITQQPMSQTVSAGQQAKFTVGASGATPLSYQWMKSNVNISGATSATYIINNAQSSNAGQYSVKVTNAYGTKTSTLATLAVTAFNKPPVASITSPAANTFYRGGDVIFFSGNATDEEDGALAASAYTWVVEFHHDSHFHPGPNIPPGVKSGSFAIAQTGESSANVKYKLRLFVMDSKGGRDTTEVDIKPHTSKITLNTVPPGLQLALEGQPHTSSYSTTAVENMKFSLEALSPQSAGGLTYTFSSWAHGGSASQTITIPQNDVTYTAHFDSSGAANCTASGSIVREYWTNITTSSVSDVPFHTAPTGTSVLTKLAGPAHWGDRYGTRIRGYICAPETGNYIFYIASDNSSELWLSNSSNPSQKTRIAFVSGYTKVDEWSKYPEQQSAPIMLIEGQTYYVEVLHRENTEGDHVSVGWKKPSGTVERPIPGSYLSPYSDGPVVKIDAPSHNSSFTSPATITISASVSNASQPVSKVEFYSNGTKIGEDQSAPFTLVWQNSVQGSYTLRAVAMAGSSFTSAPVTVNIVSSAGCAATGGISREVWQNVSGTQVSDIPVNTAPDLSDELSQFKIISNTADNYGERVRGFICPPVSGNYVFWISSDNNSELFLSTDANPANKQSIAYVKGYTQSQEYTKFSSQQSAPVALVANQKYYIEALHKEGDRGDNLSVGWKLPDGTLERPIPGKRLAVFSQNALAVTISSPPDNSSFTPGASIAITAEPAGGSAAYSKVEFFNEGTKLGEDLTQPYTYTIMSATAGTYHITAKVTDANGQTATSGDYHYYVSPVASCAGTGEITRELWNDVGGTTVADIPVSTPADVKQQLTIFKSASEIGDNYGQRIRGYVCPPVTGEYVFYISSDDNSELWLSSNEQPAGKQLIASVSGWTFPEEWTKYPSQTSMPVQLNAGTRYYIEALHKEGSQGDHIAVGWRLPDLSLEQPIPGNRLAPFEEVPVAVCEASIQPGSATTFCDGGSVRLYANTGAGYIYQWKKNNVDIPGATATSYLATQDGDYQVKVSFTGCNAWSAPERVTVNDHLTARITPGGPTTFCEGGQVILYGNTCEDYLYQWKRDGVDIPGANNDTYAATVSGSYQLKIISGSSINWSALVQVTVNDCGQTMLSRTKAKETEEEESSDEPDAMNQTPKNDGQVIAGVEEVQQRAAFNLKVYPNPTTGMFSFDYCIEDSRPEQVQIRVVSASSGAIVFEQAPELVSGCVRANIGLSGSLPVGVYVLQLRIGEQVESTKLVLYR